MSFSKALITHALNLAVMNHSGPKQEEMRSVSERRAVSAAYYALFHHINGSAVDLIAPNVQPQTNHRTNAGLSMRK